MCDQLPYLKDNPKIIFFTDFDGTITLQDSNDYLVDNHGFGVDTRELLELEILKGNIPFRDSFQAMLDSVRTPFNECVQVLEENIQFDPHFVTFYQWAREHNIPIVVLSSGLTPIINVLLERLLGSQPENIFVIANDIEPRKGKHINMDGGWQISFRDNSSFGHDKSHAIKPYAALSGQSRPLLLYAGDGVSDLSAASETDILFAKRGMGLVRYCEQREIPFVPFDDWASILVTVQEIYEKEYSNAVEDISRWPKN
ncbi:phosphoserine phosphatase [Aspergillus cavernicola]|uniref:Phosphoserine phosphatase n=1 Tax=Aspergillus cavernicola TaxID=176166 RepID=A0ABR4HJX8_9EURO